MFCRKCGNKLIDGSKFCGKCGYQTLEWEQKSVQNNNTQVAQQTSPTKNNTWIIVLVIVLIGFFVIVPIVILSIIIGILSSIPYEDYESFDYSPYIYVNNVEVETLYGLDYDSIICSSSGYNYSDHITLNYCTGEVSEEQIKNYKNELIDKYDYNENEETNTLYKEMDSGTIKIIITGDERVTIEYEYLYDYDINDSNEI